MASTLYPKYKLALLDANNAGETAVDLTEAGTIKVALVNASTDPYDAANEFYSDITGELTMTPQAIGSLSITTTGNYAKFNGDDVTFTTVATGQTCSALVIYDDTGTPTTSELIAWIDGFSSVDTNDGDITVTWEDGDATYGDFIFAV